MDVLAKDCTVLYCTGLYYTVLFRDVLAKDSEPFFVLNSDVICDFPFRYCTVLYCTVLYCTVLYSILYIQRDGGLPQVTRQGGHHSGHQGTVQYLQYSVLYSVYQVEEPSKYGVVVYEQGSGKVGVDTVPVQY